jgi:hypothetical protein
VEISKLDFIQWRDSNITQQYLEDMLEQLDDVKSYLMVSAGKNSLEDRRMVGIIEGVQWLLNWQPNFIEEGEDEDAESEGA